MVLSAMRPWLTDLAWEIANIASLLNSRPVKEMLMFARITLDAGRNQVTRIIAAPALLGENVIDNETDLMESHIPSAILAGEFISRKNLETSAYADASNSSYCAQSV